MSRARNPDHPDAPRRPDAPEALLAYLGRGTDRAARVTHVEHLPAREARHAPWPADLSPEVVRALTDAGIGRPWAHQADAVARALRGESVVVATGTASGKSICYLAPVLHSLVTPPAVPARTDPAAPGRGTRRTPGGGVGGGPSPLRPATALYLAPTKALAADQLRAVRELAAPLGHAVRPAVHDGDSPPEEREWARAHANLLLTNPDMLHRSLLPGHRRWAGFWRALRHVVVDECHVYRGVFGSHVAQVLRRLRRICAHYGADPVFLAASATVADPAGSVGLLTGVPVTAVTEDASPRGRMVFALWEPPLAREREGDGERGAPVRRTAVAETADLLGDLVVRGVRTVAFVRSRRGAELISLIARERLGDRSGDPARPGGGSGGGDGGDEGDDFATTARPGVSAPGGPRSDPDAPGRPGGAPGGGPGGRIASYRGGYLPEERRELELALRSGRLLGLAATNALELGVDVAGLDAVLIAGYPGTRASLWQQAGRAGRRGTGALAVLIARDDPLDTYLVHHPEALLRRPVEATVLDPGNPHVLSPHLCAAAAELPLGPVGKEPFGPVAGELLPRLEARSLLRRRGDHWYWTRRERPAAMVDIRGTGGDPVQVVEAGTGRLLGTVDAAAADRTVHPGAVHLHRGATFVVRELDLVDRVALVDEANPPWTTTAREVTDISVLETERSVPAGTDARLCFGSVRVTHQVVSCLRRRLVTGEVLGETRLDLPPRTLRTRAVWWTMTEEGTEAAGVEPDALPGALHAAEHAAIGMLPLFATCDRWDIGGVSTPLHGDTLLPTVFVHDGHPGGAGFAERAFHTARSWLTATREAIAACECADGCPSCVHSPKCGNGNEPLDKHGALLLLSRLWHGHAP